MNPKRYDLLDTIRGVVLVSMMIYHGTWNFVYIYGMDWEWYRGTGAYLWQQSICWIFILLSGFCFSLGKRHLKSGLLVFGSGGLVTLVTVLFMPSNRVVFGVLTCIGSCILLVTILEKGLKKIPEKIGALFSFFVFLFTKNTNLGYWGWGNGKGIRLPREWYRNLASAYLGFPDRKFYSTDYFSLLPWFFLFLTGFYLYQIVKKRNWLEMRFFRGKILIFSFLGRHSLIVYLLHQPVIYGLQELFL